MGWSLRRGDASFGVSADFFLPLWGDRFLNLAQIVHRLLQLIPVMLGVTFIVFLLMHLTPGDPVEVMFAGEGAISEAEMDVYRRELGLDRLFHEQYFRFLGGLLRGAFGTSIAPLRPSGSLVVNRR